MDIDTYWHKISQILDSDGKICYPLLTKQPKVELIIPHGNADVERIFSHMGLNKAKVRNSLGVFFLLFFFFFFYEIRVINTRQHE